MEMIKYATAALILSSGMANAMDCFNAEEAMESMVEHGYSVTFSGIAGDDVFFMAEDGKGGWVAFIVRDDALCPLIGGPYSKHYPKPPNA